MSLRPYQQSGVHALQRASASHRAVLLVAPTGAGKTFFAARGLMLPAVQRGLRCLFVVHLREVVESTAKALSRLGIDAGIVMAGVTPSSHATCQVASIQTLDARKDYPHADVVIVDEAHRAASPTYRRLFAHYPKARLVGLTATPIRGDGKPLRPPDAPFTALVQLCQAPDLVRDGFLVPVRAYGADDADVERLKVDRKTNDFDRTASAKHMRRARVLADPVEMWRKHAKGLRTVVFACNRSHGRELAQQYRDASIPAAYVDGQTKHRTRKESLERLRRGEVKVLVNCDVYTEGWDEPLLGCVQIVRPTRSVGRWLQMAGRGLRPITDQVRNECRAASIAVPTKKHLVLIDHGANLQRLGWPTAAREWSLEGEDTTAFERREGGGGLLVPRGWVCDTCQRINEAAATRCAECDAVMPRNAVPDVLNAQLRQLRAGEALMLPR
ncbi:MAG: DNA repair protein RadD [Bradymonadia bacterium]|jgi:DNA repair protein RadD